MFRAQFHSLNESHLSALKMRPLKLWHKQKCITMLITTSVANIKCSSKHEDHIASALIFHGPSNILCAAWRFLSNSSQYHHDQLSIEAFVIAVVRLNASKMLGPLLLICLLYALLGILPKRARQCSSCPSLHQPCGFVCKWIFRGNCSQRDLFARWPARILVEFRRFGKKVIVPRIFIFWSRK